MTTIYPGWLDDLRHRRQGESAGDHVARIVRGLDGISLVHDAEKLRELFLANESPERARLVSTWRTNCGTAARCIYDLAGCDSEHLIEPYKLEHAMADLQDAGSELGAMHPSTEWRRIGPGWGMLYWFGGNDAHFEFALETPDAMGVAWHGGAGRADNAITVERSCILSSLRRPLQRIFDPDAMCRLPATGDDPY